MTTAELYLCLGTNMGDRERHLAAGLDALVQRGVSIIRRSSIYETEPVGVEDQAWFLNQVVFARTALSPMDLLDVCKEIERWLGRKPTGVRFGPRPLDIDILLYGDRVIGEDGLVVPHPRMEERRFMLIPLIEIAPEATDPRTGRRFAELLERLDEGKKVRKSLPNES